MASGVPRGFGLVGAARAEGVKVKSPASAGKGTAQMLL